jgi:hypothetical protein
MARRPVRRAHRWLCAILVGIMSTACGTSGSSTSTGPTTTLTVTVSASDTTGTPPGTTVPSGSTIRAPETTPDRLAKFCGPVPACDDFATPSGNIICFASARQHGYVECAIKSGLSPPPPREGCELDQPGLTVGSNGLAKPTCRSDPTPAWFDRRIPALAYGTTWVGFGLSCLSLPTGLRCTNCDDHGFSLARGNWSTF